MIEIEQSKTADTRSCSYSEVTIEQLRASSEQHIEDVAKGLSFFSELLNTAAVKHDFDKLSEIGQFHSDFIGGFKSVIWWDNHRKINRHHLLNPDGVPDDVNLIDVIEMVTDCVMAGMARTGTVYPLNITPEVLMKSFNNTAELLKRNVTVK